MVLMRLKAPPSPPLSLPLVTAARTRRRVFATGQQARLLTRADLVVVCIVNALTVKGRSALGSKVSKAVTTWELD